MLHDPLDVQVLGLVAWGRLICLHEEENSPSSSIIQVSSMNLDVPWNL